MKISRRQLLKSAGFGAIVIGVSPRVVFATPNSLKNIRTGVQPGDKTRLVIETTSRPSYSFSYGKDQLIVNLSNTNGKNTVKPVLASGALIKRITQVQDGTKLQIISTLAGTIDAIEKNQVMLLEPNGDNDYRLVIDFSRGTGRGISSGVVARTATNSEQKNNVNKSHTKQRIIVIDPGHGGKDPDCIGKGGTQEKTVVLSVARKLKNKLDANGYKTFLTRSNDIYLKLADRAEIAEKKHADLFISLHANANPSRDMKGCSSYTVSEKASDEEAQKLADSENAADKIDVNGFENFSKDIRVALSALQQ
ncbi:MAG: N-acetylmuramoyl-L-alanine amidase, partial [Alphaproteobacteria bacterium]|nr:N-acetylmuramoyl-L-alanine amidase [Alphaproteobacteria bacterium]